MYPFQSLWLPRVKLNYSYLYHHPSSPFHSRISWLSHTRLLRKVLPWYCYMYLEIGYLYSYLQCVADCLWTGLWKLSYWLSTISSTVLPLVILHEVYFYHFFIYKLTALPKCSINCISELGMLLQRSSLAQYCGICPCFLGLLVAHAVVRYNGFLRRHYMPFHLSVLLMLLIDYLSIILLFLFSESYWYKYRSLSQPHSLK